MPFNIWYEINFLWNIAELCRSTNRMSSKSYQVVDISVSVSCRPMLLCISAKVFGCVCCCHMLFVNKWESLQPFSSPCILSFIRIRISCLFNPSDIAFQFQCPQSVMTFYRQSASEPEQQSSSGECLPALCQRSFRFRHYFPPPQQQMSLTTPSGFIQRQSSKKASGN